MPKLNVELLRKIQKHILEEPRRFMMGDVIYRGKPGEKWSDFGLHYTIPACGTVACICGWACILGGKPRTENDFATARELLGIEDCATLFYVSGWPDKYEQQWDDAATPQLRAEIAAARIDHFIKTNGAD